MGNEENTEQTLSEEEQAKLAQYYLEIGRAVCNMPANASLSYHPMTEDLIDFAWHFNRPGESTFAAANPLLALTFHSMPVSSEPS